ncbi:MULTISPECIES: LysR substrate-binding domain-containing protein [Roseobacter]|uniref:Regulatory protein NocR n=1 Tax=Roseobacter litoralis (strain ATCC 49566 / DSM 6996 / JCM 21268 / NBRC 15278 / OCh 149) TaxID=391595 RepID=F7ZLA1_ROSLO|nr:MULTISPECIES: LysR substrate-binding domain-containing protein [Roseobacter]AEI95307.1 regulatory protein NocR [Roseobacter litoralis Och 149]
MLHRLTHRQIEAFRAVMETGQVTAAADVLGTTQPSVSKMIADLEHVAGFSLFERRARQVIPTADAHALYEEVERSFVGMSEISRVIEDIRDFRKGSLMIAGMPALALKFLPDVIAEFIADEPGITVSLRARSSQAVQRHLISQQFDLGFATLDTDHPAVIRQPICETHMLAVLPVGHALGQKDVLEPMDFDQCPFIALGAEIGTRSETDAFLAIGSARPHIIAEAQLSSSICELVSAGTGISIVEPVTATYFASAGRLVTRPLRPVQPFRYDILTPALRQPSRAASRFLKLVEHKFATVLEG